MLTYNIKLNMKKDEYERLMKTLIVHQEIWNYLSNILFEKKIPISGKILHEHTYKKCRTKFKCAPSQIVIRAREDVISTFKTLKANKHIKNLKTVFS